MKKIIFALLSAIFILITVCYIYFSSAVKSICGNNSVSTDENEFYIQIPDIPDIEEKENDIYKPSEKIIDVPALCQYPELPTGCESSAAAMLLQYYGENISSKKFASEWLECSQNFYMSKGRLYGPDPDKVFAGDPFSDSSFGCFAMPIVNAVNRKSEKLKAEMLKNISLDELCTEYIDNDTPLLIWATMGMKESYQGKSWYLSDGSLFTWTAGEHCLVLIGYNDDFYFFNDPISGSKVAYEKNTAEKRFKELGSQAVHIENVSKN